MTPEVSVLLTFLHEGILIRVAMKIKDRNDNQVQNAIDNWAEPKNQAYWNSMLPEYLQFLGNPVILCEIYDIIVI